MAYTAQTAAALSGATLRQLSHCRRDTGAGALLAPEISTERPRVLYSFRDLLALRACVFLRQNVSLQKIRKAVASLRDLGECEHLSQYRLVSDGDTIMLLDGDDVTDLVRKPGQRVLAVLGDVFEPFAVREGVVVPDCSGLESGWRSTRRLVVACRSYLELGSRTIWWRVW